MRVQTSTSSSSTTRLVANRLVGGLPRRELGRILRSSESADLVPGEVLCEPRRNLQYVHFPEAGFISLASAVGGHAPLELGLVGSEGMLGATLMLGVDIAPLRAVVQGTGTALRMSASEFLRALQDCHVLRQVLSRYLYVVMAQFAQTTVCTRFHVVEKRLARWLLMAHDRAHSNHFHLTHELLANMLGVRRSGITVAAGALQKRNLIGYRRGQITVLDRKGLEAASCECYRADVATHSLWLANPEIEPTSPESVAARHPTPFVVGGRSDARARALGGDIASRRLPTRH